MHALEYFSDYLSQAFVRISISTRFYWRSLKFDVAYRLKLSLPLR